MVTLPLVPWQKADGAPSASSRGTGEASSGASQPAAAESAGTRARCTAFDSTAATSPAEDGDFPDADVFREIAEQVKRSPQEIEEHWQHCEGAAYHAAILAGTKALAEGKLKEEVAAVIESAGGEVCGLEKWKCSGSILLAEAFLIGPRAQRLGTAQEQADLEYMARSCSIMLP